jgi:hypothetical protein
MRLQYRITLTENDDYKWLKHEMTREYALTYIDLLGNVHGKILIPDEVVGFFSLN